MKSKNKNKIIAFIFLFSIINELILVPSISQVLGTVYISCKTLRQPLSGPSPLCLSCWTTFTPVLCTMPKDDRCQGLLSLHYSAVFVFGACHSAPWVIFNACAWYIFNITWYLLHNHCCWPLAFQHNVYVSLIGIPAHVETVAELVKLFWLF